MTVSVPARALRSFLPLGALVIFAACGSPAPDAEAPATGAPARRESVTLSDAALRNSGIVVEPVQSQTRSDQILAPGLIALDETRTARVGSLQEGSIIETLAQVGDRVTARQLLASMHGHALHDAWAGHRKAIADRRRLDKELAYAVDAHERAQRLYADKAISLQELQRAEVERVSAVQMLDMARAEVRRSIEELEHVGVTVPDSTEDEQGPIVESSEQIPVRSPIAGVVLERFVTPGTTVTPGSPLFVVSDLSVLWAIAEIDESHLSQVKVGRSVDVLVAAYPQEHFAGTITFIADVVNPRTRRITVRSTLPNAGGRLKPEMFATVSLGESEARPMVVVPKAAVQTIDGRTSIFVAGAAGRFTARVVELASEVNGLVEVRSGLAPGERVVVAGSFVLKSELLKPAGEGGN